MYDLMLKLIWTTYLVGHRTLSCLHALFIFILSLVSVIQCAKRYAWRYFICFYYILSSMLNRACVWNLHLWIFSVSLSLARVSRYRLCWVCMCVSVLFHLLFPVASVCPLVIAPIRTWACMHVCMSVLCVCMRYWSITQYSISLCYVMLCSFLFHPYILQKEKLSTI